MKVIIRKPKPIPYTEEELALIREWHADAIPPREIARRLKRPVLGLYSKMNNMGLGYKERNGTDERNMAPKRVRATNGEDRRILELAQKGYMPRQIAIMRSTTTGRIQTRLREMGFRYKTSDPDQVTAGYERPERERFDPEDPIVAVRMTLGSRLTYKNGIQFLDGTYCDLNRFMLEGNRALVAMGRPQVASNPAWRV